MKKLWGGRFTEATDKEALGFHSSIDFDKRLYKQDIDGSIAHAKMLGLQGIIPSSDAEAIVKALENILIDIESGKLPIDSTSEDIHSFVESQLVTRIGDAGGRLHTGRSRNDQVALDMRMKVKSEIAVIQSAILELLNTLVGLSKQHIHTVMPGFTHLQKAQPITLAHHLMAYFQMFKRDRDRLNDCFKRVNEMPLGSGALASSPYPLDREYVKEQLGFATITQNSLDAVSDRDFCIEFVFCCSTLMMHLSRFCEEIILWATDSFGFITLSDAYSTGSSIMPQKKNPDMAELIRGKTGRVYGDLIGLLTVMKGLPLAYNKDMQEDKEAVFDASDTVKACLPVFSGMLKTATFNVEVMLESAKGGYTNATDVADWLVKKGLSFREAHEIIGKLVLYAIGQKKRIEELSLNELKTVSEHFDETVYKSISVEACVDARCLPGGPAEKAMLKAVKEAEEFL